ncbi:MAG: glutamate-5-semialdehyde dehydrogenase [Rickettsiales bacterium]|nr:glutamate-5-semialdehyde dehydrogenase [Rickettsiales bacterium]RPG13352.1 MAG: glutamate-5-semialdehyde dehydrogenase [Pelagibacteraceae bacterium TMED195]|tara:strand:- start:406 stop:1671 length:1266 start_codon:yes stop_codon:yes gene_type:complete
MSVENLEKDILQIGRQAKEASRYVSQLSTSSKNNILCSAAENLLKNKDTILKANELDIKENKDKLNSATLDRLILDNKGIESISNGLEEISKLEDPVGKIIENWLRPNGLKIEKISIPLGVIGVIYESRPNVSADAAGLCLKSGNALILRGGSESFHSSSKIVEIINRSYENFKLPKGVLQYIPTKDRNAVGHLLTMDNYVDVIIPRGGRSLIERVINESKVHVIRHLDGICHTYIHKSSIPNLSKDVVINAKMRRPGICGATETILIDKEVLSTHLPDIIKSFTEMNCEVRGDEHVLGINNSLKLANEEDWHTEYLDKIVSIKTILKGVEEAVNHINRYGSGHTDAILSEDEDAVNFFLNNVDSGIVMHNTSTQFADGGEFGMGAEIGISTSKVHARGPVGVAQLTSFKYKVKGSGQIRP